MKRRTKTTRQQAGMLATAIILAVSCSLDDELMTCPYNVQLEYWYTQEMTKEQNMINNYIYDIHEYIFDHEDRLCAVNQLPGTSQRGKYYTEMTLPPGRYTAVAWGNLPAAADGYTPQIGKTTINQLALHLGQITEAASGTGIDPGEIRANIPHIYYAYSTFTVQDQSITRIRMGVTHAHCLLNVTVKWQANTPPNTRNFRLQLRDVPGHYHFDPMYGTSTDGPARVPVTEYPVTNRTAVYYTPTVPVDPPTVLHQTDARMDITRTLKGEFITHRYRDDSHILLSVYAGQEQITREIDLWKYFHTLNIDRDRNLRQEFHIVVEVQKDQIIVYPAILSDWENGGTIGGDL